MDKIFEQAKDLHVVATMIYNNGTDEFAYTDAGCTKKFKANELKEAFVKGALISMANTLFKAVGYGGEESGVGAILFIKPSAGTDEGMPNFELGTLMAEFDEELNDKTDE